MTTQIDIDPASQQSQTPASRTIDKTNPAPAPVLFWTLILTWDVKLIGVTSVENLSVYGVDLDGTRTGAHIVICLGRFETREAGEAALAAYPAIKQRQDAIIREAEAKLEELRQTHRAELLDTFGRIT